MYELTGRLEAGSLTAVARQAYTEMLAAGYTSVVEFHYLFRDDSGGGDGDAMFAALRRAARDSGIRLIYVPVLYERAGFDGSAPEPRQRRFAMDVAGFLAHQERAAGGASGRVTVGIGAHSLRAVSEPSLRQVAARAAAIGAPLHLHIAEQRREVEECVGAHRVPAGALAAGPFRRRTNSGAWSTPPTSTTRRPSTSQPRARSCASVPVPKGNLGDGLFPLERFLRAGGRMAIGSDSQATINPFEELRWLEYGQRLASESRNVASIEDPHVGRELFRRALAGGAQAAGAVPIRAGARDAGGPRGAGRRGSRCSPATVPPPCWTRCYSRDIEYRSNASWSTANGRW